MLGRLVKQILKLVPELERLRLSSIDCIEADEDLLDAFAGEARLMPHLHLSLQAGDDMILKRMKRRHSRAGRHRHLRAGCARRGPRSSSAPISSRGFRPRREDMFARTLDLADACGLTHLHVFPFSPRAGNARGADAAACPRAGEGARPAAARKRRGAPAGASGRAGRPHADAAGRARRDRPGGGFHAGAGRAPASRAASCASPSAATTGERLLPRP